MKNIKSYIIGGILSLLFILSTAWLAFGNHIDNASEIAFLFHLIPFVIGFSGGATTFVLIYYLIFWLILLFVFSKIYDGFVKSKSKKIYLSITFFVFILLFSFLAYVNYQDKKTVDKAMKEYAIQKEIELKDYEPLKSGDLIFQTSKSGQSKAIQLATKSIYSHVGIIYIDQDNYYVFEASKTVRKIPLKQWINNGAGGRYVVKRLKNAEDIINIETIIDLRDEAEKYYDKKYDMVFEWSDDKMYCSELVWKIYKRVLNIEIGELQELSDFDLSNPEVAKIIKERYGNEIPLNETVISPISMYNSNKLREVVID